MNTLVLTGFMGTGKTTVGRLLAGRYGLQFVDIDEEVERRSGCSVAELFARDGEDAFRALETEALRAALADSDTIIATGGGALVSPDNRLLLTQDHTVVCLTCDPIAIRSRLGNAAERPLFDAGQPDAMQTLLAERESAYSLYPQVDTTDLTPRDVADAVADLTSPEQAASFTIAQAQRYDVIFEAGLAGRVGAAMASRGLVGQVFLVTDSCVAELDVYKTVQSSLLDAGFAVSDHVIPQGEEHKTLATLEGAYTVALRAGLDRDAVVVGVGGGVIGDLAGMIAATYLRGLHLVLVPTTLLAQVDAAIGGKVGVDFHGAKNMIGAFKPANVVLVDPLALGTLPAAALADGLAEIIKIGFMRSAPLVSGLDDLNLERILEHPHLVRSAARHKVEVVRSDPFERGLRMLLNFGHTIGHGVEAASGYRISHGSAVSVGMVAETRLAVEHGWCDATTLETLITVLRRFSLPTEIDSVDPGEVMRFIGQDKKRRAGKIRLAVPRQIGDGTVVEVTVDEMSAAVHQPTGV